MVPVGKFSGMNEILRIFLITLFIEKWIARASFPLILLVYTLVFIAAYTFVILISKKALKVFSGILENLRKFCFNELSQTSFSDF